MSRGGGGLTHWSLISCQKSWQGEKNWSQAQYTLENLFNEDLQNTVSKNEKNINSVILNPSTDLQRMISNVFDNHHPM